MKPASEQRPLARPHSRPPGHEIGPGEDWPAFFWTAEVEGRRPAASMLARLPRLRGARWSGSLVSRRARGDGSMTGLRLLVLGPPRLERDGRPVELNLRRALALLVYLAVGDRPHGREALAALLWPDSDEPAARGRLRRTLHRL